jgi:hypothetical protein
MVKTINLDTNATGLDNSKALQDVVEFMIALYGIKDVSAAIETILSDATLNEAVKEAFEKEEASKLSNGSDH